MQLEIEREALRKEKDKASRERLEALERELSELRERSSGMKAQWQREKEALSLVGKLKQEIADVRGQADHATRAGDLGRAAELTYGRVPQLEQEMRRAEAQLAAQSDGGPQFLHQEVTADDVADVVAKWTGIPVSRMLEGERERLTRLDEVLASRVIGQREAVEAVADAVPPGARRAARPQPSDRVLHLPRSYRRRKDRDGARTRGVLV